MLLMSVANEHRVHIRIFTALVQLRQLAYDPASYVGKYLLSAILHLNILSHIRSCRLQKTNKLHEMCIFFTYVLPLHIVL